jgi:hypothetical protein
MVGIVRKTWRGAPLRRARSQLHQFLVESIQVLIAFDKKILNDFVHRTIPLLEFRFCRAPPEPRDREKAARRGVAIRPFPLSVRKIGVSGDDLNLAAGLGWWRTNGAEALTCLRQFELIPGRLRMRLKLARRTLTLETCTCTFMARAALRGF